MLSLKKKINTHLFNVKPFKTFDLTKARAEASRIAKLLIKSAPLKESYILSMPTGLGKTHAILEAIIDDTTAYDVIVACPTKELATDIYKRALNMGLKKTEGIIVFGREPKECKHDPFFFSHLIESGINPSDFLCPDCKEKCPFKERIEQAKDKPVVFTTHALAKTMMKVKKFRATLIYDELPQVQIKGINFDDLQDIIQQVEQTCLLKLPKTKEMLQVIEAKLKTYKETIITSEINNNISTFNDFITWGDTPAYIIRGQKELKEAGIFHHKNLLKKKLKMKFLISSEIWSIVKASPVNGTIFFGQKGKYQNQIYIPYGITREIHHPSIILDATAPFMARKRKILVSKNITVQQKLNINYTQWEGGKAEAEKILRDKRKKKKLIKCIRTGARNIANNGGKVLVITKKILADNPEFARAITSKRNMPRDTEIFLRHYGDIRGLDKYKDCKGCILVLGHYIGPKVSMTLIYNNMARLRGFEIAKAIKDETARDIFLKFSQKYMALMLDHAEIIQALGRIRFIFQAHDEQKQVELISPLHIKAFIEGCMNKKILNIDKYRGNQLAMQAIKTALGLDITRAWILEGCPNVNIKDLIETSKHLSFSHFWLYNCHLHNSRHSTQRNIGFISLCGYNENYNGPTALSDLKNIIQEYPMLLASRQEIRERYPWLEEMNLDEIKEVLKIEFEKQ